MQFRKKREETLKDESNCSKRDESGVKMATASSFRAPEENPPVELGEADISLVAEASEKPTVLISTTEVIS